MYKESEPQLILEKEDIHLLGEMLLPLMKRLGVSGIPSGCVMVHDVKVGTGRVLSKFQLMGGVPIEKLRGSTLLYFEPGSLIRTVIGVSGDYVPKNFFFKDCRFPTDADYEFYNRMKIV